MLTLAGARLMAAGALCVAALLPAGAQDARAIDEFRQRLQTSNDLAWLEQIAASEEFLRAEWRKTVARAAWDKRLRTDAYVRLGVIGSADSVSAIQRVETAIRGQRLLSDAIAPGTTWIHPTPGVGDLILQPQTSAIIGTRSYAVVQLESYGPYATYVMWQDAAEAPRWSRPRLAGVPVPRSWSFDPALARGSRGLMIAFHARGNVPAITPPPSRQLDIAEVERDSDGDGWTDIEERQLGMNPKQTDSDRDGLGDDVDVSPLYAAPANEASDEDAAIVRRAVLATHGLTGSRWAIFVRAGTRPVQLHGHLGPVLFGVDLPSRDDRRSPPEIRGGAQTSWKVSERTATDATVDFTDWAGISFRSDSRVTLRKIAGQWVVVGAKIVGLR